MYLRRRIFTFTIGLSLSISFFSLNCSKNKPLTPSEPDHYLIAFESYRNGYNNIFTMNDDGSQQANLTASLGDEYNPVWTYDGKNILYLSNFEVIGLTYLGVFMMKTDGTDKERHSALGYDASQPENPPNSQMIVFTAVRDNTTDGNIYMVSFDGTYLNYLTESSGDNRNPKIAPVGPYITFTSDRDGNSEIYIMNAAGANERNLSINSGWDGDQEWSPDGTEIVYVAERNGNMEIYTVNADGPIVQHKLTDYSGTDTDPSYSPDGTKIVFVSTRGGGGTPNIYVMNKDGSNVTALTEGSFNTGPKWSPDGRLIAFVSQRDGNPEIYVMNADGSSQNRLTFNPGRDGMPCWCPVSVDQM